MDDDVALLLKRLSESLREAGFDNGGHVAEWVTLENARMTAAGTWRLLPWWSNLGASMS